MIITVLTWRSFTSPRSPCLTSFSFHSVLMLCYWVLQHQFLRGGSCQKHKMHHFFFFHRRCLQGNLPSNMYVQRWQSVLCFFPLQRHFCITHYTAWTKWVRAQGPEASVFKIYYLFYVQCIFVFIEVNVMSNIQQIS